MFHSNTLFIVGAGASAEAGLPTGQELKSNIARNIDIRFGEFGMKQISGDYGITEALREHTRKESTARGDINPYLHAAWRIRDAMPQAISIDNFLDTHRDPTMELCGKLAIAKAILEAEKASKLYVSPEHNRSINYSALEDTWYSALLQILIENIRKEQLSTLFQNVSFIVFNYDRCIEHFLFHAIQNYYLVEEKEAREVLSQLNISHPYGRVGYLHWQDRNGISYGATMGGDRLLRVASQIRTFTEQVEDEASLAEIRRRVRDAETIVFLGFAFHELNMKLMASKASSKANRVFGTALAISSSDCAAIEKDILEMLRRKPQHTRIELRNNLKCKALFDEYRRTLPRNS